MDIHSAAAHGDLESVERCLAADTPPVRDCPDAYGRTAIFYAQMCGHTAVAATLEAAGWTPMPEGLIFAGPGGRRMFWAYNSAVCASQPRFQRMHPPPPAPSVDDRAARVGSTAARLAADASRRAGAALKTTNRRRQNQRSECEYNIVGNDHQFYMRKAAGGDARPGKSSRPHLNTIDVAEAHQASAKRIVRATHEFQWRLSTLSEEEHALSDEAADEADEFDSDAPPPATLDAVARFVVARAPRRTEAGDWVVLPAELEREAALLAPLSVVGATDEDSGEPERDVDVLSIASSMPSIGEAEPHLAAPAADVSAWPALRPTLHALTLQRGPSTSSSCAVSEQWEVLSHATTADEYELIETPLSATTMTTATPAPAARTLGAWADARTTRRAVDADGVRQGATLAMKPLASRDASKRASTVGEPPAAEPQAAAAAPAARPPAEAAEPDLEALAGLKDASHRVRGSRGLSVKASERREAATVKRREQSRGGRS